jgi:WhiB family transcriptional regulator, redox-sensing transcriptional regulator
MNGRQPRRASSACAQRAIKHREEYGVWAGIKLPGGQYRKRAQLAQAHEVLRRIAAGEINSRQLPENAALLARGGRETVPVTAVVLHLPSSRISPRPAA